MESPLEVEGLAPVRSQAWINLSYKFFAVSCRIREVEQPYSHLQPIANPIFMYHFRALVQASQPPFFERKTRDPFVKGRLRSSLQALHPARPRRACRAGVRGREAGREVPGLGIGRRWQKEGIVCGSEPQIQVAAPTSGAALVVTFRNSLGRWFTQNHLTTSLKKATTLWTTLFWHVASCDDLRSCLVHVRPISQPLRGHLHSQPPRCPRLPPAW